MQFFFELDRDYEESGITPPIATEGTKAGAISGTISSTLEPGDIALMSIFAVLVGLTMPTIGTHYGLIVDKIVANGRKVRADLPLVLLVLAQVIIFQPSLSWYMAWGAGGPFTR